MTWTQRILRPQDPARTFVLLNVLGFPVAAYVVTLVVRGLAILQAPPIVIVAIVTGAGLLLVASNVWLTWAAARRRSRTPRAAVVAMAAWTAACLVTLMLLGAYSPLNLAMNFAFGGLVRL